jgi:hypothetical protein
VSEVEGLGVPEPGVREWGAIWRSNPKIEPTGLDINGMSGEPPAGSGMDL